MKRVKQISVDIMVDEEVDGCELAEQIAKEIENDEHIVLGSSFQADITEAYKLFYPELSKDGFRTIKIIAGMAQEYEIINTDAPDSVIKSNLYYVNACDKSGEQIENPYVVIESMGYKINYIGCQDDFDSVNMDNAVIDAVFDYYDL